MVIVGGGATGVELAAELHSAARVLSSFGVEHVNPRDDMRIVLIEAAPRLLSQLPERLGHAALRELRKLAIEVHTGETVVEVTAHGVNTASGKVARLDASPCGRRASRPTSCSAAWADRRACSKHNRLNQLLVNGNLQTTRDPNIYAHGRLRGLPAGRGRWVPPRAQAAHQQAMYLAEALPTLLAGQTVPPFVFKDKGSLVSLSEYSSVGSLMGSLSKGSLFVEGQIARLMYWALHKQHQLALGGLRKTALITLSEWIDRAHRPRIKLH